MQTKISLRLRIFQQSLMGHSMMFGLKWAKRGYL